MNSPARKAIVVGFDGASMELVKHMVDKGYAPNIAKLIEGGVYREMLGVLPTLTPPGWTTLATGAWAGTHKVTDFNIRNYDSYIPDSIWGINTDLCKAEYIWNTAERCGKIPMLVKQEISWPPTITKGIQVEGTGPGVSNHAQIAEWRRHQSILRTLKRRPELLEKVKLSTEERQLINRLKTTEPEAELDK